MVATPLLRRPFSIVRFACWIIAGIVAGYIAANVILLSREIRYQSRAVIESRDPPGQKGGISLSTARLAARNCNLRDGDPEPLARELYRNTRLRAGSGRLEIIVELRNKFESRDLALGLSRIVRSINQQKRLEAEPVQIRQAADSDLKILRDLILLDDLLMEQSLKAGYGDYFAVEQASLAGRAEATAFMNEEVFKSRYELLKKLSVQIGYWGMPGEPFSPPPALLAIPKIPDKSTATSPEILVPTVCFGLAAGALGGLAGAFFFARTPDPKPSPSPGAGVARVPAGRSKRPVLSPEDW